MGVPTGISGDRAENHRHMRMAKTIAELESLLTSHGYTCERMLDAIVATKVPTKVYKSPAGEQAIEILVTIDKPNDCVAVEILKAFDLGEAEHREAMLRCLMTATARTPLLRPALEPEGDIRLRIDCTLGRDGARDEDVLRAVALLPSFADAWYPQIVAAMQKGKFDASTVARLDLSRLKGTATQTAGDSGPGGDERPLGDVMRAAAIAQKSGAHPNRLRALLEFHAWLDDRN
jgi:hypothetical protein